MLQCACFISADSHYMFRASGAHHQEYLKTGTAAAGTCVMVAGRSSHHHIRDETSFRPYLLSFMIQMKFHKITKRNAVQRHTQGSRDLVGQVAEQESCYRQFCQCCRYRVSLMERKEDYVK